MSSVSNTRKNQRGASALAILLVLTMTSFILLCVIKLYPVYYDHWTIMKITEGFGEEPDLGEITVAEINKRFRLRLQTNSIKGFDFDESVYVEKDDVSAYIDIDYERRVNIYKNIDAVVVFKESQEHVYR